MVARNGLCSTLRCSWLFPLAMSFAFAGVASPQSTSASSSEAPARAENATSDYVIGPGDLLSIRVVDSPEVGGRFRVSETGNLQIPGLPNPIKAAGLTPGELSRALARALEAAELLREPAVDVYVEEFRSRMVTVLGAVARPSAYPLTKPTTLLEALSMAGGLLPTGGGTLTLMHKGAAFRNEDLAKTNPASSSAGSSTEIEKIDLSKLLSGKDPTLNVQVHSGDVISVSTAPVVYVVGAVMKPGGYTLQDRSEVTVMQALALAEGLAPNAGGRRSLIVRRSPNGQERQLIPVNLQKLMSGEIGNDLRLEPNDIVFVPESGMRKSMHAMADVAKGAVGTLMIYGIGTRIVPR